MNGRKVLIGCTGSVAAIKVPILVQELVNIDDQVSPPTLLSQVKMYITSLDNNDKSTSLRYFFFHSKENSLSFKKFFFKLK